MSGRTIRRYLSAGVPLALVVGLSVIGCSETPGSADCDVVGLEHEIDHIVGEAGLQVQSLDDVTCADGWALVQATVGGSGIPSVSEPYLFAASNGIWVLKAPETACGSITDANRPADAEVPPALWDLVCAGG